MLVLVDRQQHPPGHHRLGAGRPLLVPADRLLLGGEVEPGRGEQGVPDHQVRRRRADGRRDRAVGRHVRRSPTPPLQHPRRPTRPRSPASCRQRTIVLGMLLIFLGLRVEVGPDAAARVAARRHGRPDPGVRADPRRDDGHRRRVPARPPVPGAGPVADGDDRHRDRRRDHAVLRWAARARAGRHQEGPGLLDRLAARLHGGGASASAATPPASSTCSPTASSRRCCSSAPGR